MARAGPPEQLVKAAMEEFEMAPFGRKDTGSPVFKFSVKGEKLVNNKGNPAWPKGRSYVRRHTNWPLFKANYLKEFGVEVEKQQEEEKEDDLFAEFNDLFAECNVNPEKKDVPSKGFPNAKDVSLKESPRKKDDSLKDSKKGIDFDFLMAVISF